MKNFAKISKVRKSLIKGCDMGKACMEKVNGGTGGELFRARCTGNPFNCIYYPNKCPYNLSCMVVSLYSVPHILEKS